MWLANSHHLSNSTVYFKSNCTGSRLPCARLPSIHPRRAFGTPRVNTLAKASLTLGEEWRNTFQLALPQLLAHKHLISTRALMQLSSPPRAAPQFGLPNPPPDPPPYHYSKILTPNYSTGLRLVILGMGWIACSESTSGVPLPGMRAETRRIIPGRNPVTRRVIMRLHNTHVKLSPNSLRLRLFCR